jgi:hypothetical protein
VHRTLRSSHPVKRTSTDALLIATGASALAFATSAQAGAPFSCDPTFEARAQSGNLDPESKTWIIDTARYQHRSRDFPDMPPIGELCVQSIARIAGCAPRGLEATRGLNRHTPLRMCGPFRALVQSVRCRHQPCCRFPGFRARHSVATWS